MRRALPRVERRLAAALLLAYHWWLAMALLAVACWYGWEYQYLARRLADQQTSLTKGFSRANYYRDLALTTSPGADCFDVAVGH